MIDEIAVREAHVRLEAADAGGGETGAQRRHVGWQLDLDLRHGLAGEAAQQRGTHDGPVHVRGLGRRHEEIRPEAVVDDERGLAALEHGVELDLRAPRHQAVGGRQHEAARAHALLRSAGASNESPVSNSSSMRGR